MAFGPHVDGGSSSVGWGLGWGGKQPSAPRQALPGARDGEAFPLPSLPPGTVLRMAATNGTTASHPDGSLLSVRNKCFPLGSTYEQFTGFPESEEEK